jgi:hypothetical protein
MSPRLRRPQKRVGVPWVATGATGRKGGFGVAAAGQAWRLAAERAAHQLGLDVERLRVRASPVVQPWRARSRASDTAGRCCLDPHDGGTGVGAILRR